MNDDKTDFYLLDTNCVLYFLQGQSHLASLITGNRVASNFIIEVELLGWKNITEKDRKLIKSYLNSTYFFDYSSNIKELVIQLRQKYGLKLADAFVAATAIQYDLVLISADKGFSKIKDLQFILFTPFSK
jgi:predicted nucleic acid-binding protein